MELKFCKFNDYWYTPNEILRMYSENEVGVHYDDNLPAKLNILHGFFPLIFQSGAGHTGQKTTYHR